MDLFTLIGIGLIGTAITVPVIYVFASVFHSIGLGVVITSILSVVVFFQMRIKPKKITLDHSSIFLLVLSFAFSSWMMFKTFHGNAFGEVFVGSNNVFDFGHAIGIVRSMSWGNNIPLMSPFAAGLPFFYNFMFHFLVALLEYFGIPIVWAMNIPSILSFVALIVVVYYVPQKLFRAKPIVGWLSALFLVTNSSLTFWKILPKFSALWHMQTYPFAGPFDGSTISIFITLNNYVNQRHLAFATALALVIYTMAVRKKSVWLIGVATGFLLPWNLVVYILTILVCSCFYTLTSQKKTAVQFLCMSAGIGVVWLLPYASYASSAMTFYTALGVGGGTQATWSVFDYLWQNLGILPLVGVLGFARMNKSSRLVMMPFVLGSLCLVAIAGYHHRGFEQKTFAYVILFINFLVAFGVGWVWQKSKIIAFALVVVMTVSGFVDLLPIKNEFAYPLIGTDLLPVVTWIQTNTKPQAVFVSYADIIDPVVLAGRRNYFGFFQNLGQYDRSTDVRKMYAGDIALAQQKNISYILVPKWQKNDFPYDVSLGSLRMVYEDLRFAIYAL